MCSFVLMRRPLERFAIVVWHLDASQWNLAPRALSWLPCARDENGIGIGLRAGEKRGIGSVPQVFVEELQRVAVVEVMRQGWMHELWIGRLEQVAIGKVRVRGTAQREVVPVGMALGIHPPEE